MGEVQGVAEVVEREDYFGAFHILNGITPIAGSA